MRSMELARAMATDLVDLRRRLHQVPELGLDLPKTQALLLEALAPLDLELTTGQGLSSITAVIRGTGDGPPVLLRGDMDALPVAEQVDLPYVSQHPGLMHACGHDLHMAALVGAARILHAMRDELAGDVVLMFQPGEEGPGGAEPMIAEGLLDAAGRRVEAAYALHVYSSGDPTGAVGRTARRAVRGRRRAARPRPGRGRPRLGAVPRQGPRAGRRRDRARPAAHGDPAVRHLRPGRRHRRPDHQRHRGRTSSRRRPTWPPRCARSPRAARAKVEAASRTLVEGIAAAHGMSAELRYVPGYPATVNDPAEYAFAVDTVTSLFGADRYREWTNPDPGGEDMSFVLQEVPGAYLMVSAVRAGTDHETAPDNHSPLADFDDSVLPDCAALLAELALRRTRRPGD